MGSLFYITFSKSDIKFVFITNSVPANNNEPIFIEDSSIDVYVLDVNTNEHTYYTETDNLFLENPTAPVYEKRLKYKIYSYFCFKAFITLFEVNLFIDPPNSIISFTNFDEII